MVCAPCPTAVKLRGTAQQRRLVINTRTSAAQTLQTHTGAAQVALVPVGRANCQQGCCGAAFIAWAVHTTCHRRHVFASIITAA